MPFDWLTIYSLFAFVGFIGALVVLTLQGILGRIFAKEENQGSNLQALESKQRYDRSERIVDIMAATAIIIICTLFWPLIVVFVVVQLVWVLPREKWQKKKSQREFEPTRKDLIEKLEVEEIEQREIVLDPLGAAPPVPFGFLNNQWAAFARSLNPSDEVWSFTAKREAPFDIRGTYEGYVAVSGRNLGPFFVSVRRIN